jgi:hypothetical protein
MKPFFILLGLLLSASLGLCGQQVETTCSSSSDWVTNSGNDEFNGEPFVSACKHIPLAGHGAVDVTARCRVDPTMVSVSMQSGADALKQFFARLTDARVPETKIDARVFELHLNYTPAAGSGLSLLSTRFAQVATVNRQTGTVIVSPPMSCPVLRVYVDGVGRDRVPSYTCSVANAASIIFAATSLRDGMKELMGQDDDPECDPVGSSVKELMSLVFDTADPSVAPMQTALDSEKIAIGLPLSDGSTVATIVQPQTATFRAFASACLAAFPNPPKPEVKIALGGPLGIKVTPIVVPRKPGVYEAQNLMHAVEVTQTYPDSPARLAGIGLMDIITAVNSQPVHDAADVSRAIAGSRDSCHTGVTVYRDGNLTTFILKPHRLQANVPTSTDAEKILQAAPGRLTTVEQLDVLGLLEQYFPNGTGGINFPRYVSSVLSRPSCFR